ncbi:N-acetylglucosamine kinase [Planosporangium thailandense]|uniref:N-acetylglucosamine kinase n=1 Tax=Planosporangium thailandense TaxID=765197 RepID=UPI0030B8263B
MTLFVAVDGGNSKTDVVLGTAAGEILAFVRGPGSSPHRLGVPGCLALLDRLITHARTTAGVPAGARIELISVYLAGADLPVEVDRLRAAVDDRGWARASVVDNDTFALMRAGTAEPDAIAVVCGAGINCVGRAADGRTARFPSLGPISGDWGGGHHLAQLALWHAARGEDGRGRPTALSMAVARHFGRPTVESVSAGLHLGEIPEERIAELSAVLFAVAAAGDEVAARVVARQVEEILALHRVACDRLGLRDAGHHVVLGGGVLRARHPHLHEPVLTGIRAYAPRAQVAVVTDAPVMGAALLALDALGDPTDVESALRAALRRAPDSVLPLAA